MRAVSTNSNCEMSRNRSCGAFSRSAVIVVEHFAESSSASSRSVAMRVAAIRNNEQITNALVISLGVIQVSNRTPTLVIYEASVIGGIHGTAAKCGCMPHS
jgi:hypothetical protein